MQNSWKQMPICLKGLLQKIMKKQVTKIFFFKKKKKEKRLNFISFCILVLKYYQSEDMCINIVTKLKSYMECTEGCGEVKIDSRVLPIGKWGGNFGELVRKY